MPTPNATAPAWPDPQHEEEALREQVRALNGRLREIEEAREAEKAGALVGKCFRYRNCYSCPEKASDYWYIWMRVIRAEAYSLTVHEFSIDKHGKIVMHADDWVPTSLSGWEEVSQRQYDRALTAFYRHATKWLIDAQASLAALEQEPAK